MKRKTAKKEIRIFLIRLLVLTATCWILFGVIFGITPMKNNDMFPKISAGDVLFYYRLEKDLVSGDVVVFEKEGKQYTGRIVARGGESVAVTEEEELEVNGSIVIENDIFYETPQYKSDVTYPVELKSDEYFVLEDQREGAKDSRSFGAVKKEEIKGKVITVLRRSNL